MVVLEAASVTVLLAVSLTLYVFWATSRGRDTQFQGSFLFCSLMSLICFGILKIFFPFGKISPIIFSILRTLVFSGYIMHDTNNLLNIHGRDDDSWASVCVLYMDIINLFLHLLELLRSGVAVNHSEN
ncbi:BI1-like protein [Nymphaea thermarum]|nr:BI1-like protein [Nymphaea thermarum]